MNGFNYMIDDFLLECVGEKNLQIAKRMVFDHFKNEVKSNDPVVISAAYSHIVNKHERYPCQMAFCDGVGVCWVPGSSMVYVYNGERLRIDIDCMTLQCRSNTKHTISELEDMVRKAFIGIDNSCTRSWQVGRIKVAFASLSDGVLCPMDVLPESVDTPEKKKKPGRPPKENVRSMDKNDRQKRIKKRF